MFSSVAGQSQRSAGSHIYKVLWETGGEREGLNYTDSFTPRTLQTILVSSHFENIKQLIEVLSSSCETRGNQTKFGRPDTSSYFSGEFWSLESRGFHSLAGTTGPASGVRLGHGIPGPPPGPRRLLCSVVPEIQEASRPPQTSHLCKQSHHREDRRQPLHKTPNTEATKPPRWEGGRKTTSMNSGEDEYYRPPAFQGLPAVRFGEFTIRPVRPLFADLHRPLLFVAFDVTATAFRYLHLMVSWWVQGLQTILFQMTADP